jgi:uncharacterized protein
MIAPLMIDGQLGAAGASASAVALGLAFGWLLERGGLASARKLAGQFYLTDLTVLKVMFSAILTAMLGVFWLSRLGMLDLARVYVPPTYLVPQALGGLAFGVGFVTAGLCPGTSCVAAASGRQDGLAVVAGLLAGVLLFGELFERLRGVYERTAMGPLTLPELLQVPRSVAVAGVVALALAAMRGAEWIERRGVGDTR